MRMRSFQYLLLGCCLAGLLSCSSSKIRYMQTNSNRSVVDLQTTNKSNVVRFKPDDVLSIAIHATGKNAAALVADFNLSSQALSITESGATAQSVNSQTYWVSKDGTIDFPVLGQVRVAGFTQKELEMHFKDLLKPYLKQDPIVTVRLDNFRITVLGEVNRPGEILIDRDHINIMEALALAGDMTVYGKRDEVKIIRVQPDGKTQIATIDVSSADIFSSPFFYLQQNDQIYVTPTGVKAWTTASATTGIIFSSISMLFTILNTIVLYSRTNK